jgi:hypothetical protein
MNPSSILRRAAALALVGAGIGAPTAGAQAAAPAPASIPVADGRIEHVVAHVTVSGTRAAASDVRIERWHTKDTAHGIRIDRRTGEVETEHVHGPGGSWIFDAERDVLRVNLRATGPAPTSLAQEGENLRRQVAAGAFAVAAEITVGTRPAVVLQSVPGAHRSDEPTSSTRIVADKETYVAYERTSALPHGQFIQTVRIVKAEQLPLAGNARLLRMGRHDGARKVVVGKAGAKAGKAAERAARR